MKPAFALSFSATGISLKHQSDDDWFDIGVVPLDAPDLTEQVQALRDKGFALENDLSCKVIIPSDQVRYLSVSTEGLTAEDIEQKVHDALTEATPYEISELSFDTALRGTTTYVAAVAHQTLEEARSFTTDHGFIPVRFSAEPSEDEFPQEPYFDLDIDAASASTETAVTPLPDVDEQTKEPEPTLSDEAVETTETTSGPPPEPDEEPKTPEPVLSEDDDEPEPTVHAIAHTAAPDMFRSPEPANTTVGDSRRMIPAEAKRFALPAIAALIFVGVSVGAWSLLGSRTDSDLGEIETVESDATPTEPEITAEVTPEEAEPNSQVAVADQPETTNPEPATEESIPAPEGNETAVDIPTIEQPELTPTDAAILEALKVQPTPVEEIERDPEAQEDLETLTGLNLSPPTPLIEPTQVEPDDLYLASIDKSDLSSDAIALPPAESFDTDQPFDQTALPSIAGTRFDLDGRGLVTPTPDGTLNPDGILVYQGRPSSVPPEVPVRFEEEPVVEDTESRLARLRPQPRPSDLVEQFEREQLGGRSLEELAVLRPKLRPKSLQDEVQVDQTPTALAVVRVPRPKTRPAGIAAIVASATKPSPSNLGSTAAVDQNSSAVAPVQPKTVSPKIPTTASVARQATIDRAINLRRLNLIGVYGTPANRRALVRLPSGRYKKLKVGDRIDGGRVVAIGDSELRYQKKGRNVTITMPRG
ncbi:hypothetical protein [Ruegeria sp. EL01]|uniref:hypothetical protein n=1 Tax=Ruegeria sp. EL01 TaxID=2107578 RepID=UPI000EA8287C|nr:hypothetical protein [Ruegeria sp. EL01]